MRVIAVDEGVPKRTAETEVSITVHRNQFLPEWEGLPYRQTVDEDVRNMTGVYTVRASDQDLQGDLIFELEGVDPAPRYFTVGRTSGFIFIIGDLKQDRGLIYNVRTLIANYSRFRKS